MRQTAMWQRLDRPVVEFLQWQADREFVLRGEVWAILMDSWGG